MRKDGTHFWSHVVIDPIYDPSGTLLGFAKITRDLTDRKMAEETLKQSEQQFRLLVQSVTDYAIYMLAPDGRVTNWNLGAQRIKGYSPEEVIGQHFSMFYTPEDTASRRATAGHWRLPRVRGALRTRDGGCARTVRGSWLTSSSIRSGGKPVRCSVLPRLPVTSPK